MANETILIVDADTKSQKVLEVHFKSAGYRVMITETMAQAQELLAAETPDLIITDTRLPDGDGFLLCEHIKQQPVLRDVPLIFLTEEGSLPRKMRGFELGATDYLTKPIYIKEIVGRVELALQQRAKSTLTDADAEQIEGELSEITMVDLLQTIEVELRSGTIQLERNGIQATVYFQEGNILDAVCGKLQGEEALYRLMLWPRGKFVVRYHEVVKRPDVIEKDSTSLLLEGMRRLDRWNEMVVTLPHLSRIFEPDYKQLTRLADDLPMEVVRLVRLFDGYRTLRDAIDDSPVDDLTTLHILRKLLEDEVLQDVTPHEAPLSQTSQHTNLATWLAARPELAEERKAGRDVSRTSPGLPHQPVFRPDEISEPQVGPAPSAEGAGLGDHVSEPLDAREEEAGQVPTGHQQPQGEPHWSFHWEQGEAKQGEGAEEARSDEPEAGAETPAVEPAPAPVVDPEEALRAFEAQEQRRREEEARQLAQLQAEQAPAEAAEQAPAEEATLEETTGLLLEPPPGAERPLDVWMRGGSLRRAIDAEKAGGEDVYVPRDPTQEMHRNVMLAQIEAAAEQRERMSTPLAMPAQAPAELPRRPTPRDPYEGIEDMLASRASQPAAEPQTTAPQAAEPAVVEPAAPVTEPAAAPAADEPTRREAALDEADAITREAAEQLQRGGQAEAAEGERRRTTDQFAAIRPEQAEAAASAEPAKPVEVEEPAPLIALGSPEDEISEPKVEAPPSSHASSGADAFQEEDEDEDEDEDDEEYDEDEDDEDEEDEVEEAPVAGLDASSSAELRAVRENKDIPLPHRTARDSELIHTEYDLSKRKTQPPRERLDPDSAEVAAAHAKVSQDDKTTAKISGVKVAEAAAAASAEPAVEPAVEPVVKPAVEEPASPAKPADPQMSGTLEFKRREDPIDDFLAVDPQSGFNFKGLAIVAVVILVVIITISVAFNESNKDPAVAPAADMAAVAQVDLGAPDLGAALEPDLGAVALIPDMGQAAPLLNTITAEPYAIEQGKVVVLTAAKLALLHSGVDPESVLDPLNPNAVADMGVAAAEADMAVAVAQPDMAQAPVEPPKPEETTQPSEPPKPQEPAQPPSFDERMVQAERFVKNESMSKAKKLLRPMLAEQPDNAKVHYLLGRSEVGSNNGQAIQLLIKAKMLGFDDPELFVHLGTAYQINGDKDKARKNYEEYLKRAPSGKLARDIRAVLSTL